MDHSIFSETARNFGIYFFNPVAPSELESIDPAFKNISATVGNDEPLYLTGLVANEYSSPELASAYTYRPLDDFDIPKNLISLGAVSFVTVYGSKSYDLTVNRGDITYKAGRYKSKKTVLIEKLLDKLGLIVTYNKNSTASDVMRAIYSTRHTQPNSDEPLNPVVIPMSGIKLSRPEILDLLRVERTCVVNGTRSPQDPQKLIAMYDAVIHSYETTMRQNMKGHNIRFADGSRKWVSEKEAKRLLSLPVSKRIAEKE